MKQKRGKKGVSLRGGEAIDASSMNDREWG